MKIYDYLSKECIDVTLSPVASKKELFITMINIANAHYGNINIENALKGLLKREGLGSTGVGKEIAIPHTGLIECQNIIPLVGIIKDGMEFESIDSIPAKIIFMILFPEKDVTLQLRFLARVSRLLRKEELRIELIKSDSPQRVMDIFRSYEDKHFG